MNSAAWRGMYCGKWNLSHLISVQVSLRSFTNSSQPQCLVWGQDGKKGTLQHVLSACPTALSGGMYTWRHNNVLRVTVEAVEQQVEHNNATQSPDTTKQFISFVKKGSQSRSYSSKPRSNILSSADDWQVRCDLDGIGGFPEKISVTALRPDIIIWSETGKEVIIGELTVPWEDNIYEAHERKRTKYTELAAECRDRGWKGLC